MKYSYSLLAAAALWLLPTTLNAQAKQLPTPFTPVSASETSVLGANDVISIQVGNHGDLDQIVVIGDDGKIILRDLGQFTAAGKTREVLRNEIQVQADKTLNNAPVYLTMREHHTRFSIDGGVGAPGVYEFAPGMKVLDAISAAKGLPFRPNRYTGKLIRKDKGQALDIVKIYANPEGDANLTLQPNDKLVINEIDLVRHKVTVLGQVGRPSTYETDNDTSVLTLLGQAGGISQAAALTKVTVTRGNTIIPLDLRPVLVEGKDDRAILNFRFEDGDVLSVPGVETKYQVLGQVNRPASYILPEKANVTVLDALNVAGGPTQNANLKGAVIRRTVKGKATDVKVDFDAIQKKGSTSANVLMQPDDILIIPQRGKRGITLQDVFAPIGLLNLLGFRILGR
jgi:protein involved in polysaccharide export with SLBB domain